MNSGAKTTKMKIGKRKVEKKKVISYIKSCLLALRIIKSKRLALRIIKCRLNF